MKKNGFLTLLCLVCLHFVSNGQYMLTPVPPPSPFTFNDLWHFTVVRSNADAYGQFYVSLRIYNETNQLKVKSNSTTVTLAPGSHYYNLSNISTLQPFTSSYYDANFLQQAIASGGFFPPGTYRIVYTLYGKAADGEFTPLAEDNLEATIDIMWPPLLLWPEDKDTLNHPNPPLSWTPAFSSSFNGAITYNLRMVQMLPGQKAATAMASNPAFFTANNLDNTFYAYGAGSPPLVNGQTYVWQVTAVLGSATSLSQIWEFTYANNALPPVFPSNLYTPLRETVDNSYHLAKDRVLKIKYTEEYEVPHNAILAYNVYDQYGILIRSSLAPLYTPSVVVKKGDNYISLSLAAGGMNLPLSTEDIYLLEVLNHKNEKRYLRFKIILSQMPGEGPGGPQ